MKNKVLVTIYVPEIDKSYDLFIPVNEQIWKIKKLIIKALIDINNNILNPSLEYILINKESGKIYSNNTALIDTDIRNVTQLCLISEINAVKYM